MLSQRKCVFLTSAMPLQMCLFCTIWHQTQQTAGLWQLLALPHLNGIYCCLKSKPESHILRSPLKHAFSPPVVLVRGAFCSLLLQQLSGKSSEWLITGWNRGMMWLVCPPTCQHITDHVLPIYPAINQHRTSRKLSWFTVLHIWMPEIIRASLIIGPRSLKNFYLFSSHL